MDFQSRILSAADAAQSVGNDDTNRLSQAGVNRDCYISSCLCGTSQAHNDSALASNSALSFADTLAHSFSIDFDTTNFMKTTNGYLSDKTNESNTVVNGAQNFNVHSVFPRLEIPQTIIDPQCDKDSDSVQPNFNADLASIALRLKKNAAHFRKQNHGRSNTSRSLATKANDTRTFEDSLSNGSRQTNDMSDSVSLTKLQNTLSGATKGSSCHQCKSRRSHTNLYMCRLLDYTSICTYRKSRSQCKKKYCAICLHKFYSERPPKRHRFWPCPSCRGVCCCAACKRQLLKRRKMTHVVQRLPNKSSPTHHIDLSSPHTNIDSSFF